MGGWMEKFCFFPSERRVSSKPSPLSASLCLQPFYLNRFTSYVFFFSSLAADFHQQRVAGLGQREGVSHVQPVDRRNDLRGAGGGPGTVAHLQVPSDPQQRSLHFTHTSETEKPPWFLPQLFNTLLHIRKTQDERAGSRFSRLLDQAV